MTAVANAQSCARWFVYITNAATASSQMLNGRCAQNHSSRARVTSTLRVGDAQTVAMPRAICRRATKLQQRTENASEATVTPPVTMSGIMNTMTAFASAARPNVRTSEGGTASSSSARYVASGAKATRTSSDTGQVLNIRDSGCGTRGSRFGVRDSNSADP